MLWLALEIALLCLVSESERKTLCSLSAPKPNSAISKLSYGSLTTAVSPNLLQVELAKESENLERFS